MLAVAALFIAGWLLNSIWIQLLATGIIGLTVLKEGNLPTPILKND